MNQDVLIQLMVLIEFVKGGMLLLGYYYICLITSWSGGRNERRIASQLNSIIFRDLTQECGKHL